MQLPPQRSYLRLNLYSAVHITDHSMFYSSHGLSQDEINKLACSQCIRKSLFTSIPLPTGSRLHWEFYLRTLLLNDHNLQTTLWTCSTSACLTSTYFQYNGKNYKKVARYSYELSCFCYCSRNCDAKYRETSPSYLYAKCTSLVKLRWRHFYICTTVNTDEIDDFREHLRHKADIQFTKESRKMVKYLF